jgi:hypothetical protein
MNERLRDQVDQPVTLEYFQKRWADGWRVTAIEWQRDLAGQPASHEPEPAAGPTPLQPVQEPAEIPYGLRISGDCAALEANPDEMAVMMVILQEIVKDQPFSLIAGHLNRQRLKTRAGRDWTSADVFELMPRLIDAGPQLLKSSEWPARRLEVLRRRA